MKVELQTTVSFDVKFFEVSAGVRYWEDASVNGVTDSEGTLIPLRNGDCWSPVIHIDTGVIKNWPAETTANIHYKVCDQGKYWLQDEDGKRVVEWKGFYVPDEFLSPKASGYGDYIILKVDTDGKIANWEAPAVLNTEDWGKV